MFTHNLIYPSPDKNINNSKYKQFILQRNKLKKICCWQKVKPQVNPESKPRVKLALGRVWSVLYVQQRLTSTWGRTLYIQVTPHKDSQRSLSAHTCYLQQTHTYFRGPTLYIHVHVISNKYKHVKRPLSVHTCYLQQTNIYQGHTLYIHVTSNKYSHCLEVPVSTGDK